jgi:hypothetical protein
MTAIDELRAGKAGTEFLTLLVTTLAAVARVRNFPPPSDHHRWDDQALTEVAGDFLADAQTPRRMADLAVHCADDGALRARLQGAVINFLRDRGRQTEVGRLIRRVRGVLADVEDIESLPEDRWRLVRSPRSPSGASPWHLEAAANRERQVVVPAWGHDAKRNAPVADRDTILRLVRRVLIAADGALTSSELARSIAPRLGLRSTPLTILLDASLAQSPAHADPADLATRGPRAIELFEGLPERQRLALAHYDLPSRQLAPVLGVSRTQAAAARAQAFEWLRQQLVDDDDAEGIAMEVIELAQKWLERRTIGVDMP